MLEISNVGVGLGPAPPGRRMRWFGAGAVLAAVAIIAPAVLAIWPLPAPAQDAVTDPPARVGRLSQVSNVVSFHTAGQEHWERAEPNLPVTTGTAFWTEPGARATIQLGLTALRLDGGTETDIVRFDDLELQASLPVGAISLRVRALAPDERIQIVTPTGTVAILVPGRYRVEAGAEGHPAQVTVFDGSAQVMDAQGAGMVVAGSSVPVTPGQALKAEPATVRPLDVWSDREEASAPSSPANLPPDMPGAGDLAAVGSWSETPQYGSLWYPPVAPGWVPYRHGHWVFQRPWGWTWVDDASWGFAPFHYGRWIEINQRWAWCPGPRTALPVFAPALVEFVDVPDPSQVGAPANVGWIPLGPQEVYRPPFPTTASYVQRVNLASVPQVASNTGTPGPEPAGRLVNLGAATVVPALALIASRPIAAAARSPPSLAQAHTLASNVSPATPTAATSGAPGSARSQAGGATGGPPDMPPTTPGPPIRAWVPGQPSPAQGATHQPVNEPAPGVPSPSADHPSVEHASPPLAVVPEARHQATPSPNSAPVTHPDPAPHAITQAPHPAPVGHSAPTPHAAAPPPNPAPVHHSAPEHHAAAPPSDRAPVHHSAPAHHAAAPPPNPVPVHHSAPAPHAAAPPPTSPKKDCPPAPHPCK